MVFEVYDVRNGNVLATAPDESAAQALTVGVEVVRYRWAGLAPEPAPLDPLDDYWSAKRASALPPAVPSTSPGIER